MLFTKPNPEPPQKESYELARDVVILILGTRLIEAVKLIKEWTGMGLYDSKRVIDLVREEAVESYGHPENILDQGEKDSLYDFAEGALIATVKMVNRG